MVNQYRLENIKPQVVVVLSDFDTDDIVTGGFKGRGGGGCPPSYC